MATKKQVKPIKIKWKEKPFSKKFLQVSNYGKVSALQCKEEMHQETECHSCQEKKKNVAGSTQMNGCQNAQKLYSNERKFAFIIEWAHCYTKNNATEIMQCKKKTTWGGSK